MNNFTKVYNEVLKTVCQTPDAMFHIKIGSNNINCEVELPFDLDIDEKEAKLLETNIHNALELILSKYFI